MLKRMIRSLKKTEEIVCGADRDFFGCCVAGIGEGLRNVCDKCWLVALAAMRDRCEEWAISLNRKGIRRYSCGDVAKGLGLGEGDVACERDAEPHVDSALGVLPFSAEAVEHAAETRVAPVRFEEREGVVPGRGRGFF